STCTSMQKPAKEVTTKATMHTFKLPSEHYGVANDVTFAFSSTSLHPPRPTLFPYTTLFRSQATGSGGSYEDIGTFARPVVPTSTIAGIDAYTDSTTSTYVLGGQGAGAAPLTLQLTSGQ